MSKKRKHMPLFIGFLIISWFLNMMILLDQLQQLFQLEHDVEALLPFFFALVVVVIVSTIAKYVI